MTKKYKIPVYWTMVAEMEIEAETLHDAIEMAYDDCDLPKGEYLDSSFEVNEDCVYIINGEKNPILTPLKTLDE